jgi:hypothetical protein
MLACFLFHQTYLTLPLSETSLKNTKELQLAASSSGGAIHWSCMCAREAIIV